MASKFPKFSKLATSFLGGNSVRPLRFWKPKAQGGIGTTLNQNNLALWMRVALHVFHTRQIRTPGRSTISPGILAGLRAIHQAFPLPATSAEAVDSSQYYPADMELDGSLEAFESIELDELLGYFGIEDPAELDEHAQETLDKIHAILHAADISSDVFKP